jgi:hypothetical protein
MDHEDLTIEEAETLSKIREKKKRMVAGGCP